MGTFVQYKNEPLIIMQHLILGMNAHINLDLGVAAASFYWKENVNIQSIKKDFILVNDILKELTDEMQSKISKVSKLMFLLDWLGKDKDEIVAGFSIVKARDFAWDFAESLAPLTDIEKRKNRISEVDGLVTSIAQVVFRPPGKILNWLLGFIRMFEEKNAKVILAKLEEDIPS